MNRFITFMRERRAKGELPRDAIREWHALHADENKEKRSNDNAITLVKSHNNRAVSFGCEGELTLKDIAAVKEIGRCLACGSTDNLTVDHVIPLSKGGINAPSNLQCLCWTCNNKKGQKSTDYR